MVRSNQGGARAFCRYLSSEVDPSDIGKFVITLLETCNRALRPGKAARHGDDGVDLDDSGAVAGAELSEEEMEPLLDAAAVLCSAIAPALQSSDNKAFCKRLTKALNPVFDRVVDRFEDSSSIVASVHQMRAHIPASSKAVTQVVRSLQALEPGASAEQYAPLIDCACEWGKSQTLLDMVADSLGAALGSILAKTSVKRGKQAGKKSKGSVDATGTELPVDIAFGILNRIIRNLAVKGKTLSAQDCVRLRSVLRSSMDVIRDHFKEGSSPIDSESGQLATKSLAMFMKLEFYVGIEGQSFAGPYCEVIAWATQVLLPKIEAPGSGATEKGAGKRKRAPKKGADAAGAAVLEAGKVASSILNAITDTCMLSGLSDQLAASATAYALALQAPNCGTVFLLPIGRLVQHMLAATHGDFGTHQLDNHIQELAPVWLSTSGVPCEEEVLFGIRPSLITVLKHCNRRRMLSWALAELAQLAVTVQAQEDEEGDEICRTALFVVSVVRAKGLTEAFVNAMPELPEYAACTRHTVHLVSSPGGRANRQQTCGNQGAG